MADEAVSDVEDAGLGMFKEPEDFYEPEKQLTTVTHTTSSGQELSLRLLGHSPLWVGVSIFLPLLSCHTPSTKFCLRNPQHLLSCLKLRKT